MVAGHGADIDSRALESLGFDLAVDSPLRQVLGDEMAVVGVDRTSAARRKGDVERAQYIPACRRQAQNRNGATSSKTPNRCFLNETSIQ